MRDNERADEAKSAYVYGIIDTVAQPVVRVASDPAAVTNAAASIAATDPRMVKRPPSAGAAASVTPPQSAGLFTIIVSAPPSAPLAAPPSPIPAPIVLSPRRSRWSLGTRIAGGVLLMTIFILFVQPSSLSIGGVVVVTVALVILGAIDYRRVDQAM